MEVAFLHERAALGCVAWRVSLLRDAAHSKLILPICRLAAFVLAFMNLKVPTETLREKLKRMDWV